MNDAFIKYISNPQAFTIKSWLSKIIPNKINKHELVVDRISKSLVTQEDCQALGGLIGEIYQAGYLKAVNDYKSQLEKMGIKINIVEEPINQ